MGKGKRLLGTAASGRDELASSVAYTYITLQSARRIVCLARGEEDTTNTAEFEAREEKERNYKLLFWT
jgi:hypothetical protein